uniref:Uncharacterized protein n=1 Tax=Arundo donax TaxID=35708 RepID=A0A0A8XUV9_ARUDO
MRLIYHCICEKYEIGNSPIMSPFRFNLSLITYWIAVYQYMI